MKKILTRILGISLCLTLTLQLTGCGTLLYPERKGQKAGRVDIGIALLDGIGLFFFLIPGVIAYAVDFNNGTIYLPGSARSSLEMKDFKQVRFDPKHSTKDSISKVIQEETGRNVALDDKGTQITRLKSMNEMYDHFVKASVDMPKMRIALLNE